MLLAGIFFCDLSGGMTKCNMEVYFVVTYQEI